MKHLSLLRISMLTFCGVVLSFGLAFAQQNEESNHGRKFEQLGTILPTPNQFRNADGAPGPSYWQQRCDYDIKCSLVNVTEGNLFVLNSTLQSLLLFLMITIKGIIFLMQKKLFILPKTLLIFQLQYMC